MSSISFREKSPSETKSRFLKVNENHSELGLFMLIKELSQNTYFGREEWNTGQISKSDCSEAVFLDAYIRNPSSTIRGFSLIRVLAT